MPELDEPVEPEVPELLDEPEVPEESEAPELPDVPEVPEVPVSDEEPLLPGIGVVVLLELPGMVDESDEPLGLVLDEPLEPEP